jgi:hypothetical protein
MMQRTAATAAPMPIGIKAHRGVLAPSPIRAPRMADRRTPIANATDDDERTDNEGGGDAAQDSCSRTRRFTSADRQAGLRHVRKTLLQERRRLETERLEAFKKAVAMLDESAHLIARAELHFAKTLMTGSRSGPPPSPAGDTAPGDGDAWVAPPVDARADGADGADGAVDERDVAE